MQQSFRHSETSTCSDPSRDAIAERLPAWSSCPVAVSDKKASSGMLNRWAGPSPFRSCTAADHCTDDTWQISGLKASLAWTRIECKWETLSAAGGSVQTNLAADEGTWGIDEENHSEMKFFFPVAASWEPVCRRLSATHAPAVARTLNATKSFPPWWFGLAEAATDGAAP